MSYCRWSSDNFKCDLYIYEGDNGYIIHVCNNKYLEDIPPLADIKDVEAYHQSYLKQNEFMEHAVKVPIGLPHDGETFVLDSLEDLLRKVQELKVLGYRVPDYVTETIQGEINEKTSN